MAIVDTLNVYQFRDAFKSMNRDANFSYDGLGTLFDWLEEMSEGTGEPIEMDVIAFCCEYAESTAEEILEEYGDAVGYTPDDEEDDEEDDDLKEYQLLASVSEFLGENTSYVEFEYQNGGKGFIYAQF